jgi:phosphate starvation-inducible PhoH-like protein
MGLKQAAQHAHQGRRSDADRHRLQIAFEKDRLLSSVFGHDDQNLIAIENRTGVSITARGGRVSIDGDERAVRQVEDALRELYRRASTAEHVDIDIGIVEAVLALYLQTNDPDEEAPDGVVRLGGVSIRTRKKTILPRTVAQAAYMQALGSHDMIFALGPAGTGKTYIAVAQAVSQLLAGTVQRLVLSRPAVEAGERLGFLPGDMKDKVDPYLRPIYDALYDCLPAEQVERRIAAGEIEVAPIAFMRGRTLADAFVLLDEAQNTTPAQMKMFLTRFGEGSRMVVCGDPNQTDLPGGPASSGLADTVTRLEGVQGMAFSRFGTCDVVRHPIVGRIVRAYED